jgi:hypothetical protein
MLAKMKSILRSKGYRLFIRPYELNIVGLRSRNTEANRFDDEIHVFYKIQPFKWHYHVYKATTDPGTFWLKNPLQPEGTAILAQGQYVNAYAIGMHQGKYKALIQKQPVTVLRDYDRNAYLDFLNGKPQSGLFGINIHRALISGKAKVVDKFSAGCQVFENTADFNEFMMLCEKHKMLYGNVFTYTLVDFRAARRATFRLGIIGTLTLGMGVILYQRVRPFFQKF